MRVCQGNVVGVVLRSDVQGFWDSLPWEGNIKFLDIRVFPYLLDGGETGERIGTYIHVNVVSTPIWGRKADRSSVFYLLNLNSF